MTIGCTVKAVGADLAFGHANALDEVFQLGKLQACETETTTDFCDHTFILRRIGGCIFLQNLGGVFLFVVADDAASNQFVIALGRRESDEGTAIDEWGTGDADVYLLGTTVEESLDIVA